MKYKILLLVTSIFLLILQSFSQTQERIPWPSLADSPWPVLRGDVQGTKRSEYVGPKTPNIIWEKTYQTGIINGPLIGEDGNLYFGSRYRFTTDTLNYFYCTDSSGNEIWRFETDYFYANDGAPLLDKDGNIYFGARNGIFYALNPDGSIKWEYNTSSPLSALNNLVSDKEGNIYITNVDSLYCFSPEGEIKFTFYEPQSYMASLAFSPSGDILYLPAGRSPEDTSKANLKAIDLNGNVIWKKEFDFLALESLMVDNDGRIYVEAEEVDNADYDRALICMDENGNIVWKVDDPPIVENGCSPTIDAQGNITFPIYKGLASVTYDGNLRWIYNFEIEDWFAFKFEEIIHSLVCDADGTIYAGSSLGNYLYAISSEGELLWKVKLNGQFCDAPPAIGKDGTLYVGTSFGFDGVFSVNNNLFAIKDNPNSVEDEETPTEFALYQNYPNPFNPTTRIKYQVANTEKVNLIVYDILGREIATLVNEIKPVGTHEVELDASALPSGIFFYRLQCGDFTQTKKMMVIK